MRTGEFHKIFVIFLAIILSGCQSAIDNANYLSGDSGCRKFYKKAPVDESNVPKYSSTDRPPPVIRFMSDKPPAEFKTWLIQATGQGYYAVGSCSFSAAEGQDSFTPIQAKWVDADAAISLRNYASTEYSSNQYGGSSYRFYDWHEVYFKRSANPRLMWFKYWAMTNLMGFSDEDISDEDRKIVKRNSGAIVRYVVRNGPAFYSELMAGDVVIGMDGKAVLSSSHLTDIVKNKSLEKISKIFPEFIPESGEAGVESLASRISSADPGVLGSAHITYIRDGIERSTDVPFMRIYESERIFSQ